MKKYIILFLIITAFSLKNDFTPVYAQTSKPAKKVEPIVYICNSNTAYAYHTSSYCRGLNRCTHGMLKVPLSKATKTYGRKACKICG